MYIVDYTDIPTLDYRYLTRHSDRCLTKIILGHSRVGQYCWLKAGASRLRLTDRDSMVWTLDAYYDDGVTDQEEDSAFVYTLPLIGVTFDCAWGTLTTFKAFLHSLDFGQFRLTEANYSPATDPEAFTCERCEEKHLIIPHYVPPQTQDTFNLFKRIRGAPVEIQFITLTPEE